MQVIDIYHPDHPGHEAIRKTLVRKIDLHVLPALSLLWLACFIDRTNVGNAKVGGLDESLGLKGNEYNIGLAVFYITYILSELPSNYMLKRLGGKLWLPFLVAGWATISIFSTFMRSFRSFVVIRLLLGLFEGGLLPGMVIYLSSMYKRNELQLRIGVFFASASLSGAFGGLLAFLIEKMEGIGNQREGIATIFIALFALYQLPAGPSNASFLTPEERVFAAERLMYTQPSAFGSSAQEGAPKKLDEEQKLAEDFDGKDVEQNEEQNVPLKVITPTAAATASEEKFEMYEVLRGFKEPQVWMTGLGYMSLCVGLYSYIVAGMGYKGSDAQLFASFPYLPASALVVIVAFFGDKLQLRGPVVVTLLPITILGYVLAIIADSAKMRYAAVFLMAAGIYPSVPSILCILPNNTAGTTKKSVCTALQLMIANCSGFIATFIYTEDQKPHYKRGHSIALAFTCLAWFMLGLNSLYCLRENRQRLAGRRDGNITKYQILVESGKTSAPIGDRAPSFKLTI
ncbi:major facilitator superfamily domain-containing protein [Phakopsora pachyrhizi]|uniref:Major facilitator superfamily domain-containing protein n=1 Tax=Phakopsora pachyrhizi TaxID=170000 RepID=A0AAV0ALH8_PHAPC|nr:major facilitator superfamily domain-containing protein [Phakopsora pachyrhizi]